MMTQRTPSLRPVRRALAALGALVLVAGCGGGGSSSPSSATPVASGPRRALPMLTAGLRSSYWVGKNGRALSWGSNASGQMGDGTMTKRYTPVSVRGPRGKDGFVEIAAGESHTLAITSSGSVFAWGHNKSGQLGHGDPADQPVPAKIGGLARVRSIAGGSGYSMALRSDGAVLAWGNNQSGQLGDGNAPIDHSSPAQVHGLGKGSGVVEIAAGASFGLVRKANGAVLAWGNGTSGQLGFGGKSKLSAPTQVRGLGPGSGVIQIAAGKSFSMALKKDGTVLAWGNNASGQLGDGTAPTDQVTPVQVSGLGPGSGVVAIAAGGSFALALKIDGTVLAWGNNASGQLGDGTAPTDHPTPVAVSGLGSGSGVTAITAGGAHSLALKGDGTVLAWGNNGSGQLGDGTGPTDHATSVVVSMPVGSR